MTYSDGNDSVEYLIGALSRWLAHPRENLVEVKESHTRKLNLLTGNRKAVKEYQRHFRLYVMTIDYYSTGESRFRAVFVNTNSSEREFLEQVCRRIGGYYAIGAQIHAGMPKNDAVFDDLVSLSMKKRIAYEDRACAADRPGGYINYYVETND